MRRIDTSTAAVDLFGPGKNGFRNGDPALAILATRLNAEFFNSMQEEVANTVEGAGLTLTPSDSTQLFQAVQLLAGKVLAKSVAGGTNVTLSAAENRNPIILLSGALTANINVIVPAVGRQWIFANNTTGSFSVTIKTAAGSGIAVPQGGALQLYCDATAVFQVGASASQKQLQTVTGTVAANALTLGLATSALDFRSPTLSSGAINTRPFSALSLVVPSGATLGTSSGVAARLILIAIDATALGGGVEPAVVNLAGGLNLDEAGLINTTALSAGATAKNVVYSQTARAGVPYRVVGFHDVTETTAGTWAAAPTVNQGIGGQALAALSSIGYGQTWQSVIGGRVAGTNYVNATGRPIQVVVWHNPASTGSLSLSSDGVLVGQYTTNNTTSGANGIVTAIIPPGATYSCTVGGSAAISGWVELR